MCTLVSAYASNGAINIQTTFNACNLSFFLLTNGSNVVSEKGNMFRSPTIDFKFK